jgi:hypothetical protein
LKTLARNFAEKIALNSIEKIEEFSSSEKSDSDKSSLNSSDEEKYIINGIPIRRRKYRCNAYLELFYVTDNA